MSEEQKDILTKTENSNESSSYRSIFKSTSLFGGVQIFQILILIIRSKFVAILLGPAGMGLSGLYNSTISLVQSLTSLGVSQSAVRNISQANGTGDTSRTNLVISVVRRIVWLTGLLGVAVLALFSPLFSKTTFGDYNHIIPLICLSIVLLLNQLKSGETTIMQGMRKLKDLASVSLLSSLAALIVTIPFYYIWGIDGIVPVIIVDAFVIYLITKFFSNKTKIDKVKPSKDILQSEGKSIVTMGIALSIGGVLSVFVSYIIRRSINAIGGLSEVGLYNAGFAILNTYVGMVFTAMGTDFYPRLAAVNDDNAKCSKLINQQGETALLILGPLLLGCLVFLPFIIRLIYSSEFLPVFEYVAFAIVGIIFKAASWVIAFIFIAKAEKKLYMILEAITSIITIIISLFGYYFGGLKGLGVGFSLSLFVYMIMVSIIAHRRYSFSFSKDFCKVFLIQFALVVSGTVCVMCFDGWQKYLIGSGIILVSGIYSIIGLNNRMNLLEEIKQFISKKHKS